jgi:uncharacterized protein (TIGR04551 family)
VSHAARAIAPLAILACATLAAPSARATGFTDIGQDIVPRDKFDFALDGYLRLRGDMYDNLSLNRGVTPSGQPFFPVSLSDPNSEVLTYADMRLRTDLTVYSPMGGVAVKMRADILDNQPLGGGYAGIPAAATTQTSPVNAFVVKRAYGEALTPIGLLAAGRMGNSWGLGILANGGDCADCDSGDAADRIAFISPVLDHIVAMAYDFTATGPFVQAGNSTQSVGIEPTTDVHTVTFAILHFKDELSRRRRQRANKTTVEYGAYVSHRWQDDDIPAAYLPTATPVPITASQVMDRGYNATAMDGWGRLTFPAGRIEAEVAYIVANVEQASLIPGVLYHQPITSNALGMALESELSPPGTVYGLGFDAGYASGDNGPGFGALPKVGAPPPQYGDLYAEATPPFDTHANTFRFHSDYRIDQILFREIVGNVANCVYLRPHARVDIYRSAPGTLSLSVAGIASWAAVGQSAPGGQSPLGVEVDPTLAYVSRDGFLIALDYGVLFPMAGLDNTVTHMDATTAQLARARLMYLF